MQCKVMLKVIWVIRKPKSTLQTKTSLNIRNPTKCPINKAWHGRELTPIIVDTKTKKKSTFKVKIKLIFLPAFNTILILDNFF